MDEFGDSLEDDFSQSVEIDEFPEMPEEPEAPLPDFEEGESEAEIPDSYLEVSESDNEMPQDIEYQALADVEDSTVDEFPDMDSPEDVAAIEFDEAPEGDWSDVEDLDEDSIISDELESVGAEVSENVEEPEAVEPEPESVEPGAGEGLSVSPGQALSDMAVYMSEHNYGKWDYAEYSRDPEWQRLNEALIASDAGEPTDAGVIEDAYDYGEDVSVDWADTSGEEGLEPVADPAPEGLTPGIDSAAAEVGPESVEALNQNVFLEQGVNEFGFEGTCGETTIANTLNLLRGTDEFTENEILKVAVENDLCMVQGADASGLGGTTTEQFMGLYERMNELTGGAVNAELYEYEEALSVDEVARKLDEGNVINVAVDSGALWDLPHDIVDGNGKPIRDAYSDHWISVTGVERNADGSIKGFNIIDSGGGETYVSRQKYEQMCFGDEQRRVLDPTCIVVSNSDAS